MTMTTQQRKHLKTLAHHLKPVVTIAANGLSATVVNEVNRALADHELIKVKINAEERQQRSGLVEEMVRLTDAELVNLIGKTATLLRKNPKPNPKLSNLIRSQAKT